MLVFQQQIIDKIFNERRILNFSAKFFNNRIKIQQIDWVATVNGGRHTRKNQLQTIRHAIATNFPLR